MFRVRIQGSNVLSGQGSSGDSVTDHWTGVPDFSDLFLLLHFQVLAPLSTRSLHQVFMVQHNYRFYRNDKLPGAAVYPGCRGQNREISIF